MKLIKSSERESGVTLSDEAKRETPVRTEPHPTRSFYLEVVQQRSKLVFKSHSAMMDFLLCDLGKKPIPWRIG
jgi:hypothetical protein